MGNERKLKLIDLGAESLADALLKLALRSDTAADSVERMIATPEENTQRFKKKLTRPRLPRHFVHRSESSEFADELRWSLQDLKASIDDPFTGVELVASFYETDKEILESCDDSDGCVGDIYRSDAKDLFVEYASRCTEKKKVADIVLELNQNDGYGVRDALIDCAIEYLSEPDIRLMITKIQKSDEYEYPGYEKRHCLRLVESLARQVKDAPLFEQSRIAAWGKLSTAAYIDIARVYLESGDIQTALSRLEKIPENETYQAYERDQLLLEIYRQLGDDEKLIETLYRKFRSHYSIETLQELLNIIGDGKQNEVVSKEVIRILAQDKLSEAATEFLIAAGKTDEAETYLLERADQLNGNSYMRLLPLAKAMESKDRDLAASIIYRSLLNSILERGYTKAYPHGVRYLKKLDKFAASISDWGNFDNHEAFKEQLHQTHGRKRSFWSRYEVKP